MRRKNWFWGFLFLCAAALIIINQLGIATFISPMRLVLTILLVFAIIQNIPRLEFFSILFPAAFLIILYKGPLGITSINTWSILFATLFLCIGLSMFIKPRHRKWSCGSSYEGDYRQTIEDVSDDEVCAKVSLGSDIKYIYAQDFKRGDFTCTLGSLKLYFDQATLHENGATIFIDVSLGDVVLYVPHHWEVIDQMSVSLGDVKIVNRHHKMDIDPPTLTLAGHVSLGDVKVHFI